MKPKPTLLTKAKNALLAGWHKVLGAGESPRALARGAAIGAIICTSPTYGFRFLLGTGLPLLFRSSVPASLAMILLFGHLIFALPIYWFNYELGRKIVDGPHLGWHWFLDTLSKQSDMSMSQYVHFLIGRFEIMFWPLMVGSLVTSAVAGVASYLIVLFAARAYQRKGKLKRIPPPPRSYRIDLTSQDSGGA